jgi:hypothetical protein
LAGPHGLAFDSAGDLFASENLFNIYEFAPNGTRSSYASGFESPWGLAFAVPEPSAGMLIGLGSIALLAFRNRRVQLSATAHPVATTGRQ